MGPRLLDIYGHALSLDYRKTKSRGEYAARSLAFRIAGPVLYEQDHDGNWFKGLCWSAETRRWRTFGVGDVAELESERLRIHRWGHIWPIPEQIWVEIHDTAGRLLHQQEMRDEFYFTPPSGPKQIRLRRLDEDGVYTNIAVLKDDVWQALDSWPQAQGLAGTITFRVPAYQLATEPAPLGPRSRLSPLAERTGVLV